ncbi:hypothetical protein [Bifidobacterium choerinum]|uniref:DUF2530 domain-containing protein n=1 Tax=Bifidobacterium choerinum TaxID=35760 RepID=A0A087ABV8_9BIFI|nr:hypothetical protein [Bifidobacterium choerinum]ATU20340.1 hypothetical protein BcFMB_04740 [Bifidobacterium choerinum]KFI56258.1 hypothetical protein BCHO_1390 [Bifidobacterium choerinum]
MKFAPIIDPHARRPMPKPVQVDLRKAFIFGTILWTVALVVCGCCWYFGHIRWFQMATFICAFGMLIGFALLIWEHFDRSDYRRLGQ